MDRLNMLCVAPLVLNPFELDSLHKPISNTKGYIDGSSEPLDLYLAVSTFLTKHVIYRVVIHRYFVVPFE